MDVRGGRLAELLHEELDRRKLSQAEFARLLPVAPNTVRNWLNGDRPSPAMCVRLAEVLEHSPLWAFEAAGYAPGISGLRDLTEQLMADNDRLLALLRRVPPAGRVHTGLAALVDYLAAQRFSFRVVPWCRGTVRPRHYADWIVFDPRSVDAVREPREKPQDHVERNHSAALALAGAWWDGPENWEHVLTGRARPESSDLVLNVPRFVAARSGGTTHSDNAPRDIAVLGGHWCGHIEAGRYLAGWLDYSFSLPSLAASVVHQVLMQRWDQPNWHGDRLLHVHQYALRSPVTGRRVWGVEYWDDASAVRAVTDAGMPVHLVLLWPDDDLCEYAATRRQELGHCTGRSRREDLATMRRARDDARRLVDALPVGRRTVLDVGLPSGVWSADGRTTLAAMDTWLDQNAATAARIHRAVVGTAPPADDPARRDLT